MNILFLPISCILILNFESHEKFTPLPSPPAIVVAVAADVAVAVAADVAVHFKVALHTDKRVENFFSNVWPELPFFARKKPMPIKVNASLSPSSPPSSSSSLSQSAQFVQLQKHRPQNEEETPTQAASSSSDRGQRGSRDQAKMVIKANESHQVHPKHTHTHQHTHAYSCMEQSDNYTHTHMHRDERRRRGSFQVPAAFAFAWQICLCVCVPMCVCVLQFSSGCSLTPQQHPDAVPLSLPLSPFTHSFAIVVMQPRTCWQCSLVCVRARACVCVL